MKAFSLSENTPVCVQPVCFVLCVCVVLCLCDVVCDAGVCDDV